MIVSSQFSEKVEFEVGSIPQQGSTKLGQQFWRFSNNIRDRGVDSRGVGWCSPDERDYQLSGKMMFFFWVSVCCSLRTVWDFLQGPIFLELPLMESLLTGLFGALAGACMVGIASVLGKESGFRSMAMSRYIFGRWVSKVVAFFGFVWILRNAFFCCTLGGQVLYNISNGKCPEEVGTTIVCLFSSTITLVGIRWVRGWNILMSVPLIVLFVVLYIRVGIKMPKNYTYKRVGDTDLIPSCLSFFWDTFISVAGWASVAGDYYIYFPETTSSSHIFVTTTISVFIPSAFAGSLGICAGTAFMNKTKVDYHAIFRGKVDSQGYTRALTLPLEGLTGGIALIALMTFSLITANIVNMYSLPFTVQSFHHSLAKIPRWLLAILGFVVVYAPSIGGRFPLMFVVWRYVPSIGYWIVIWLTIIGEELLLFRRGSWKIDWEHSECPKGWAAFFAIIFGTAGAVVGQQWFGALSILIFYLNDQSGIGDLGLYFSFVLTAIVYAPLRAWERHYYKR